MSDTDTIRRALGAFKDDSDKQGDRSAIRNALDDTFYAAMDSIYKLPYPERKPTPIPAKPAPKPAPAPVLPTGSKVLASPAPTQPTGVAAMLKGIQDNIAGGQKWAQDSFNFDPNVENVIGAGAGVFNMLGGVIGGAAQKVGEGANVLDEAMQRNPRTGELPTGYKPFTEQVADVAGQYNERIQEPLAGIGADLAYGSGGASLLPSNQNPLQGLQDLLQGNIKEGLLGRDVQDNRKPANNAASAVAAGAMFTALNRGDIGGALDNAFRTIGNFGNEEYDRLDAGDQLAASLLFDLTNLIPGMGIGELNKANKLDDVLKDVGKIDDVMKLLPESKIQTPLAKITETVKSALGEMMQRTANAANADELFDTWRAFEKAGVEGNFDQIAKVYAGVKTLGGNRATKLLQGFSKELDEVEAAHRAVQTALSGVAVDTKTMPKAYVRYLDDVKAKPAMAATSERDLLDITQGQLHERAQQYMAKQAKGVFPIKGVNSPTNIGKRFLNELKGFEALAYIGLSPFTFIRNVVNGVTTMAIEGLNPLWDAASEVRKLQKAGQVEKAANLQKAIKMQSVMSRTGDVVRGAFGEGQFATSQTGAFGSFMSRMIKGTPIGKPLQWYQAMEEAMRAKVWTQTQYKAIDSLWRVGKGFKPVDAGTAAVLHQYRVSEKEIHNLIEEIGPNEPALIKAFKDLVAGKRGAAIDWDTVAAEVGMTRDQLTQLMDEADYAKFRQMAAEVAERVARGEDKAAVVDEVVAQAATDITDATSAKAGLTQVGPDGLPMKAAGAEDAQLQARISELNTQEQELGDELVRLQGSKTKANKERRKEISALLDRIDDERTQLQEALGMSDTEILFGKNPTMPEPPKGAQVVTPEIKQFDPTAPRPEPTRTVSPIIKTVRERAATLTAPKVNKDLLDEWADLFHEGASKDSIRAIHKAIAKWTPEQYLEHAQSWVTRARAEGHTWINQMADMFEERAHYVLEQMAAGNPRYKDTAYWTERVANGDALVKLLRGGDSGFNWTKFERPYGGRGYERFIDYRKRVTDAAIERDFINRPAGDTGVSATSAGVAPEPVAPTSGAVGGTDNPNVVSAPERTLYNIFAGMGNRKSVTLQEIASYDAVKRGKASAEEVAAYLEGKGITVTGRTPTVKNASDAQLRGIDPNEMHTAGRPPQQRMNAVDAIENLRSITIEDEAAASILSRDEMVKSQARKQADILEALHNIWNREEVRRYQLGTDAENRLMGYLRRDVLPGAHEVRQAAQVAADWMDNAVMISRDGETKFDAMLGVLSPFQFWRSRFAVQSLRRIADKPARLAWYLKLREGQDQIQDDPRFPKRLQGMMKIGFPGAPAWAGDMYADVLEYLTSIEQTFGANQFQDDVTDADIARVIRGMAKKGTISLTEAANVIANQSGTLWDQTKTQMEELAKTHEGADSFATMFRPHLPFDIGWKVLTGNAQDIGVLFPATRIVKNLTGVNIEQPLKAGLRAVTGAQEIPDYDMWEEQRTDKALADMVGNGELNPRDALIAMIERRGSFFEQAKLRSREKANMQMLSVVGGQLFPAGEKEYYKAKVMQDQLINQAVASLGGNPDDYSYGEKWDLIKANGLNKRGTPLGDFYKNNPAYDIRGSIYDEPEARLKSMLADEVWKRYNEKGALDKRLMNDDLGEGWKTKMLDKETRNLENVTLDELGEWVVKARGYVPQQELLKPGEFPEVRYGTPDQNARYTNIQTTKEQLFDMDALAPKLNVYGELEGDAKYAYRDNEKDLDAYLDWYGTQLKNNPDIGQLINPDYQASTGSYVNTRDGANDVTRYTVQNLENMIRRIGGRQGRGGGGGNSPFIANTPPGQAPAGGALSMNLLTKRAQNEVKQRWANPKFFLSRDVYGELFALYRKYRQGAQSFDQWLQLFRQMVGGR